MANPPRSAPEMHTLALAPAKADFRLAAPGEGIAVASAAPAQRNGSRGADAASLDQLPGGEELLEKVSERVYELLMDDLEQSFESR